MTRCPSCGVPALPMPACPECGAPYPAPAEAAPTGARWTGEEDDRRLEKWLRIVAPPLVFALGLLCWRSPLVAMLDSMWLHELGHAITAWLSGFVAFPGPWVTSIAETRSPLLSLLLAAGLAGLTVLGWRRRNHLLTAIAAGVLLLQLVLTLGLRVRAAQALILFGGDGGNMVLGAALFTTFFAARGSHLQVSWLRWGFLVLGGFGFAHPFMLWTKARRNLDLIPFGEIVGLCPSDPTRLVDDHGWSVPSLISRYVILGVVCVLVMAAAYVWGITRGAEPPSDRRGSPAPPG